MKTLLILRHAKSDQNVGGPDFERPLTSRGTRAAKTMGRFLASIEILPDLILASSAVRARTTAELLRAASGALCPLELRPAFYGGAPQTVVDELRQIDDRYETVLIVGHEPTWSSLVGILVGGGQHAMVTAALAAIQLGIRSWRDLIPSAGELTFLLPPRLLDKALD
jgi:phosphohistidine phosphatase